VVDGLVDGFLPLEDRLLLALEGGRKAGGQAATGNPKAERSAWLRVVDRNDYPEIDLRVDMHTDTVADASLAASGVQTLSGVLLGTLSQSAGGDSGRNVRRSTTIAVEHP
jgi:uncharacterized Ntn-hydrolase superfamily protein